MAKIKDTEVPELDIGCHQEGADRQGGRGRMRAAAPQAPLTLPVMQARWACFASVWRPYTGRTSPKGCYKKKCKSQHVKANLRYVNKSDKQCVHF